MTEIFPTALIVLNDGTVIEGHGFGAENTNVGEICFHTGMTGYQETLTDPSFASQIITFTFPHIGNVGANDEDLENNIPRALGLITREKPTRPSNFRSDIHFDEWLQYNKLPGIYGVDTRALTRRVRDLGAPNGVLAVNYKGEFDRKALIEKAKGWSGLEGLDLAKTVSTKETYEWNQTQWALNIGFANQNNPTHHVVAIDFGAKTNILRCLASAGCKVTVVNAQTSAEDILAMNPDGVFLSNGPGDPAATGEYAVPTIQALMNANMPIFGICLGHQLLALALGGQTRKMHLGHRGANQPVKDLTTNKVEITSQNHGFEVVEDSLPNNVTVTHTSLFDGSNEGIRATDKDAFSVQYHPEASPGPMDSYYLFERFVDMIKQHKLKKAA